jgi:cyclopropane-fatty-acyl-phospholipid synthase
MLFEALLKRFIHSGTVRLIDTSDRTKTFGDGKPPMCTLRLTSKWLGNWLAFRPSLRIGEAFMDGTLVVEEGDIYDFLEIVARNLDNLEVNSLTQFLSDLAYRLGGSPSLKQVRRNVAHHYDLTVELYDTFLDRQRQYSCAYFRSKDDSLDVAQRNKVIHIASKLYLHRANLKILDIGSGWGGLGLYLATEAGANVTGITLSQEQERASNEAAAASLSNRAHFYLRDYRDEQEKYDRIVSVGMLEHVGHKRYREYFEKLKRLLNDDGVAVVHSIGYSDKSGPINPFIRKYIFPGADIPSLSEVFAAIEESGLIVTDVEILRLHYAETLRKWRGRFIDAWDEVVNLYDDRFARMWVFYLALCEIGFRYRSMMVFQIQLAKRREALPLTRDYMIDWELEHLAYADSSMPRAPARRNVR